MAKKRIIVLAVLLIGGGVLAYTQLKDRWQKPSDVIEVSGNFEVTDVELSFRLPGWVKERPVDEGDLVKTSTVVARLDDTELKQEVALRTAELGTAEAALAELDAGSRPEEIHGAEANYQRAKAALAELEAGSRPEEITAAEATAEATKVEVERTKLDYDRLTKLLKSGASAQNEYDTARSAYFSAVAKQAESQARLRLVKEGPRKEQIDQARSAMQATKEQYDMVKKGPREETKQQARARVEQLRQALEQAKTRLGYCVLTSPVSGVVLSKNTEAGEFVAAGTPIVTVGDLRNIWLRAYISDEDLGKVKLDAKARIRTDSYPNKDYWGKVTFISQEAEFTPKNVQTQKERVKQVYRIKITVPNEQNELKPGMPADAFIQTTGTRE
jgi:HlyD family secretion protein